MSLIQHVIESSQRTQSLSSHLAKKHLLIKSVPPADGQQQQRAPNWKHSNQRSGSLSPSVVEMQAEFEIETEIKLKVGTAECQNV